MENEIKKYVNCVIEAVTLMKYNTTAYINREVTSDINRLIDKLYFINKVTKSKELGKKMFNMSPEEALSALLEAEVSSVKGCSFVNWDSRYEINDLYRENTYVPCRVRVKLPIEVAFVANIMDVIRRDYNSSLRGFISIIDPIMYEEVYNALEENNDKLWFLCVSTHQSSTLNYSLYDSEIDIQTDTGRGYEYTDLENVNHYSQLLKYNLFEVKAFLEVAIEATKNIMLKTGSPVISHFMNNLREFLGSFGINDGSYEPVGDVPFNAFLAILASKFASYVFGAKIIDAGSIYLTDISLSDCKDVPGVHKVNIDRRLLLMSSDVSENHVLNRLELYALDDYKKRMASENEYHDTVNINVISSDRQVIHDEVLIEEETERPIVNTTTVDRVVERAIEDTIAAATLYADDNVITGAQDDAPTTTEAPAHRRRVLRVVDGRICIVEE